MFISSRLFIGEGCSSLDPSLGTLKDIAARTDEEVNENGPGAYFGSLMPR